MAKIVFLQDGIATDAQAGEQLADVVDRAGALVPFSCRDGTCGTCLIEVKRGGENLNAALEKEKETLAIYGGDENKHRLCCQCVIERDGDIDINLP